MNISFSTMFKTAFAIATFSSVAISAKAGFGYQTSFKNPTDGPFAPTTLSGQDSWDTTDYATGATSGGQFVGQADALSLETFSGGVADYYGRLGGRGTRVPGLSTNNGNADTNTVSLFRTFSVTDFNNYFAFNVDFGILSSTGSYPGVDTFGFSLNTTSVNNSLLAITFQKNAISGQLDIFTSLNGGATLDSLKSIDYDANYSLSVFINPAGNVSASVSGVDFLVTGPGVITNAGSITQVAITQKINDTTITNAAHQGAGDNEIQFDNYSAVPEPSTVGLSIVAGIGGLFAMLRRRNKAV